LPAQDDNVRLVVRLALVVSGLDRQGLSDVTGERMAASVAAWRDACWRRDDEGGGPVGPPPSSSDRQYVRMGAPNICASTEVGAHHRYFSFWPLRSMAIMSSCSIWSHCRTSWLTRMLERAIWASSAVSRWRTVMCASEVRVSAKLVRRGSTVSCVRQGPSTGLVWEPRSPTS